MTDIPINKWFNSILLPFYQFKYDDGFLFIMNKFTGKLYKPSLDKTTNYFKVRLHNGTEYKGYYIHRLIGMFFIPNYYKKPCIDHIDANRKNNKISNLRWVSYAQNSNNKNNKKYTNNKSGVSNICFKQRDSLFCYKKCCNRKVLVEKYFKTLDEALSFKNTYPHDNSFGITV